MPSRPNWNSLVPSEIQSMRTIEIGEEGWMKASGDKPDNDDYVISIPVETDRIAALRLEISPEQTSNFVVSQIEATWYPTEPISETGNAVKFSIATADFEQDAFPASSAIKPKLNRDKGWAISPNMGQEHQLNLAFGEVIQNASGILKVTIKQQSKYSRHLLDAFRLSYSADESIEAWTRLPESIKSLSEVPVDQWSEDDLANAREHFRSIANSLAPVRRQLKRAQSDLAKLKPVTTVPVMQELPSQQRRTTKIQIRGNYQSTGETVDVGVPEAFHEIESDGRPTRLNLARWLISPDNPLTARVIVNRHWEQLFGIGIVETSEEFGSQGELPSHPELLDWLAVELVESGWDVKRLVKLIVMSETYRQSSKTTAEAVDVDPANRMLTRGPRFRISAEMVRDQALAVSGLLVDKFAGPPAKPPQPSLGLKAAFGSATDWSTSEGEDRYRRGLYTTWRRSNPYPSMAQFDAPNREVCTVRRIRTNTPLQALVTLNDPVYVEAAQAIARRCVDASATTDGRIEFAFKQILTRSPTDAETKRLTELVDSVRQRYEQDPEQAMRIATDPLGPLPANASTETDAIEYATWTVVGNVMLNLDELLMKR
ncbi:hypothetical protein CGZ80_26785 [Rhodopirellula sp. MGV]|nr:hypothetical protein CGZ80_26785 [Rhodopirellula sp. MGV]